MTMKLIGTSVTATAKECCYRCERNQDLVDLDAMIVGEGFLALCRSCIKQAAEAAGLMDHPPEATAPKAKAPAADIRKV